MSRNRKSLDIIIAAKNRTDKGVKGAMSNIERLDRTIQRATGGFLKKSLEALAGLGAVELGLGGLNATADLLSGNLEDGVKKLERLPAGLGPVVVQLKQLLGNITGINGELVALEAIQKSIRQSSGMQFDIAVRGADVTETLREMRRVIDQQTKLALASPAARPGLEAAMHAEREAKALEAQIESLRAKTRLTEKERKSVEEARNAISKLQEQRPVVERRAYHFAGDQAALARVMADFDKQFTPHQNIVAGVAARRRESQQAFDDGLADLEAAQQRAARAARFNELGAEIGKQIHDGLTSAAGTVQDFIGDTREHLQRTITNNRLRDQLKVSILQSTGDVAAAQREQLRQHYRRLIDDAKAVGNDIGAGLLGDILANRLAALDAVGRGKAAMGVQSPVQSPGLARAESSRFLTGVGRDAKKLERDQLAEAKKLNMQTQGLARSVAQMAAALAGGTPILPANFNP